MKISGFFCEKMTLINSDRITRLVKKHLCEPFATIKCIDKSHFNVSAKIKVSSSP